MNNLSGRLVVYLVGGASIFVFLFGIRGSASVINPILLATVITITVLQNFIQPKLMGQSLKISPVVVLVGLLIWGYLLGGVGALLAVPMTLLVLIILENFDGTRSLAVLMRYTGEEKKEERREAAKQVKGLWGRVKETFSSDDKAEDVVEEPEKV